MISGDLKRLYGELGESRNQQGVLHSKLEFHQQDIQRIREENAAAVRGLRDMIERAWKRIEDVGSSIPSSSNNPGDQIMPP